MSKSQKTKGNPQLEKFAKHCKREFGFLETEHALTREEPQQITYELSATYANDERRVIVFYEHLSQPWIMLQQRHGNRWREASLQRAFAKLHPEKKLPPEPSDDTIEDALDYLSRLKPILEKDFDALFEFV